jgi:hypothetical protein
MVVYDRVLQTLLSNYSQGHSMQIAQPPARPPLQVPTSCWKSWPSTTETGNCHTLTRQRIILYQSLFPRLVVIYLLYSIWMFPKNRAATPKITIFSIWNNHGMFPKLKIPPLTNRGSLSRSLILAAPRRGRHPPRERQLGRPRLGRRGRGVAWAESRGTVRTAARAWKVETSQVFPIRFQKCPRCHIVI